MRSRAWGLVAAFAVLTAGAVLLWGYQTDDTWIHLRFARNLAERGEFAFNPGEPSYGSTAPLWIFSLVFLMKLGLAPLAAVRLLGLLSGATLLLAADRLLSRLSLPAAWRPALLVLVAADAWFLRWTMSGMETPLAGALLLVLLGPAVASGPTAWVAWGAAWGLGTLVRPELAVLAPTALPWLLWLQRRRHPGRSATASLARAAAGWLLVAGPWFAYARFAFGRIVPGTAAAKSYAPNLDPASLASHLARSLEQIGVVQGALWLGLLFVGLRFLAARRRGEAGGEGPTFGPRALALAGIALTWTVVLVGGYAVKQVWTISRYLSPLHAPLLLAGAALAAAMVRRMPAHAGAARRVLAATAALALLGNGALLVVKVRPYATTFTRGIAECFTGTGLWLRDNTPPNAVVAALDIGAVGYASERRIMDLAGLVSPGVRSLGRDMGFEAMVASGRWLELEVPDYLFDRTPGPPRWAGRTVDGVEFVLLETCGIASVGLREADPWTYALYRLVDRRD
ncbi:MAG: hypothetical protein IPI34_10660 [bacterium]|nr:hypothetical protein [bacterium]